MRAWVAAAAATSLQTCRRGIAEGGMLDARRKLQVQLSQAVVVGAQICPDFPHQLHSAQNVRVHLHPAPPTEQLDW
jgi:hypothetical protein